MRRCTSAKLSAADQRPGEGSSDSVQDCTSDRACSAAQAFTSLAMAWLSSLRWVSASLLAAAGLDQKKLARSSPRARTKRCSQAYAEQPRKRTRAPRRLASRTSRSAQASRKRCSSRGPLRIVVPAVARASSAMAMVSGSSAMMRRAAARSSANSGAAPLPGEHRCQRASHHAAACGREADPSRDTALAEGRKRPCGVKRKVKRPRRTSSSAKRAARCQARSDGEYVSSN